ncbi:Annexin protein, partial [Phytophthora megakarya]
MGGAESAEMDAKQKLAAAGKTTAKETQVKTVEGGVTTYTSEKKAPVTDFEAVSEQKSSKGKGKTHHEPETEPNDPKKAGDGETKTEVFRTVEPDGCVVVKTVKTTRTTATLASGELITTIEVETTTETEEPDGDVTTSVKTETTTEREGKSTHRGHDTKPSATDTSMVETGAVPSETVQTEVFQSQEADGSIVTKTVKTTTRFSRSTSGEFLKTIEIETTTETETTSGEKNTTVETETREEIEVETTADTDIQESSLSRTSVLGGGAIRSTVEAGTAPGESVQTEVFQSQEADGSIVTKTVKTTTRITKSSSGELVKSVEVETTTETETTSGEKSTTVETETREETDIQESSLSRTSVLGGGAIRSTVEAGTAPGESVQTEVFQSQEADGSIVTTGDVGSTETTEVTETVTTEDVSGVTSEDVGGDVTGSVTERGGYAVTSGWTSGTGAKKPTAETTETTETTEETIETTETTTEETTTEETTTEEITTEETTVTSEDVSGDRKKVSDLTTAAIGAAATGAVIGSAVSATRSKTTGDVGATDSTAGAGLGMDVLDAKSDLSSLKHTSVLGSGHGNTLVVLGLSGGRKDDSMLHKVKKASFKWSWMAQFVSFCAKRGKDVSEIDSQDVRGLAREFCSNNLLTFSQNVYESGSFDEKQAAWNVSLTLSVQFPELAVHQFGVEFGQHKRVLMIDEVDGEDKKTDTASAQVLTSILKDSCELSGDYENVLIMEGGETVFYGSAKSLIAFFQEFGFVNPQYVDTTEFLLGLSASQNAQFRVTIVNNANENKANQQVQNLSSFVNFPDDTVLLTVMNTSGQPKKSTTDDDQKNKKPTTPETVSTTKSLSSESVKATSAAETSA